MINVVISGFNGKMGQAIHNVAIAENENFNVVAGIVKEINKLENTNSHNSKNLNNKLTINLHTSLNDINSFDMLIDFSTPESTIKYLQECIKLKKPIVVGTTGFNDEQLKIIKDASKKIPILFSSNMSIGVNLLFNLLEISAKTLGKDWNISINEIHHKNKKDAPSGTALSMGQSIAKSLNLDCDTKDKLLNNDFIKFSYERTGDVAGEHSVTFNTDNESITFLHNAKDRTIFAKGALLAAEWLSKQKPGFYSMREALGLT